MMKTLYGELSKRQISDFLGMKLSAGDKYTKEQLVQQLVAHLAANRGEESRLLVMFPQELAVGPNELELLLHCSRTERKRWTKEGKIAVLAYRTFRIAGKDQQYPVYDRCMVLTIGQEDVLQWRAAQRSVAMEHRKAGRDRATKLRKVYHKMRQDFFTFWQTHVGEWERCGSIEIAAVFQLAYWATAASHWAKENHIKALAATTRAATYAMQRDAWYERKNEAMHALAQTPHAQLSFYRPDDADKMTLQLCDEHYDLMKGGYYENKWTFYKTNTALVTRCTGCLAAIETDYYALYFIEVAATTCPETHFSFHVPYALGKELFPAPQGLPIVKHMEQEGTFRFGRTISPHERIVHPEHEVATFLAQALAKVRMLYRLDDTHTPVLSRP